MNDLHQITERFILALDDIHLVRQQAIFDLLAEVLLVADLLDGDMSDAFPPGAAVGLNGA